jgi:hypothetical protein
MIAVINFIEKALAVIFAITCLWVTSRFGIHYASIVLSIGMIGYGFLWTFFKALKERERIKVYAKRVENIFEYNNEPEDRQVRKRASEHIRLMKISGNKDFLKGIIHVHALYYQNDHGGWQKEEVVEIKEGDRHLRSFLVFCNSYGRFLELCKTHIVTIELEHHKKIAKEDGKWYTSIVLQQDIEEE